MPIKPPNTLNMADRSGIAVDIKLARSQRFADQSAGAFSDRDQHDVHDPDAAHQQEMAAIQPENLKTPVSSWL